MWLTPICLGVSYAVSRWAPHPLAPALQLLVAVATVVAFPAVTIATIHLLEPEHRRKSPSRWAVRAAAVVAGVGLWFLGGILGPYSLDDGFRLRAGGLVIILGGGLSGLSFRVAAEGLARVLDHLQSLRSRFVVLALVAAALALVIHELVASFMTTRIGAFAISLGLASIVWGIAAITSEELTDSLNRAVHALARLASGDLSVQLEVRGKDEVSAVARAFNAAVLGLRERDFVERAFGRYASPEVLRALRSREGLQLAPERREVSVLFADIRGFTAMSESARPEEVMAILNAYFGRLVQIVEAHGGYINKFIGDAVMVIFGAPSVQADHAARAVACARAFQAAVAELNAAQAFGARHLAIGVGVNTGPAVAGSLGGEARAEYTVIGDTVNVASRFCSAAKPGEVLIGAASASACGLEGLTALPPMSLKGKSEPIPVFKAA